MKAMIVYRSHCTVCRFHVSACTLGALIDAQRAHERYMHPDDAVDPFAWMM